MWADRRTSCKVCRDTEPTDTKKGKKEKPAWNHDPNFLLSCVTGKWFIVGMFPCHTDTQDKVKVMVVTQALASVIVFSDISRNEVMTLRSRSFSAASIISLSPGKSICIPLHNASYQANISLENLTALICMECLVHTLNWFNHLNFYYVT